MVQGWCRSHSSAELVHSSQGGEDRLHSDPLIFRQLAMPGEISERDRSATFVSLLAAGERQLTGFVLALVPNFADADEVLQETKLRLWEQFDNYDPAQSFDGWARSIAYYQILTFRKKTKGRSVVFSTDLVATLANEYTDSGDEVSERAIALQGCLQRLSEEYRTMLRKYYSRSWSVDSLAESMEISVAGLRKRLYRCRRVLHNCITRAMRTAEGQAR